MSAINKLKSLMSTMNAKEDSESTEVAAKTKYSGMITKARAQAKALLETDTPPETSETTAVESAVKDTPPNAAESTSSKPSTPTASKPAPEPAAEIATILATTPGAINPKRDRAESFKPAQASDDEFERRERVIATRMKALGIDDLAQNQDQDDTESGEQVPNAALSAHRTLGPAKKTDSLANIRQDLAQLNEDMSTGEQFYAQSLKRISNLINYAYETEANLAALERLEPENQRLTELLEIARKTATDQTVRAESMKSKADAYEARYMETRQNLETSQLTLSKLEQDKEQIERELAEKDTEIASLKNSNRTIRNEMLVDRQTQEKLSAKALSLSSALSLAQSEKLELEKRGADIQSRYEQAQSEKEQIERLIAQTRSAHKAAEEHNIALKAEIEQILSDVQIFKKQFDTTARQRDHEINALRAKVSDLKSEVDIKADIVTHAHAEMAELREKHDAAHRGRRKLLDHIESEKLKQDALNDEIETAKSHTRTLYSQIVSAQAEADQLRRTNQMQSEKLAKYMALNTRPVSAEPAYPRREGSTLSNETLSEIEAPLAPPARASTSKTRASTPPFTDSQTAPKTEPVRTESRPERRSPDRPFQAKAPEAPKATPPARDYEPVAIVADPEPKLAPGVKADAAMRESARYGMVGGISADYAMGVTRKSTPPQKQTQVQAQEQTQSSSDMSDFDNEFAQIDEAGRASQTREAKRSEADQIEDTLANFHEIDLLDNIAG